MADFFTRASDAWEDNYTGRAHDYRVHFFAQRRERVLSALGEVEGKRILDLGCASGDLTFALASLGAVTAGADLTKLMVHRSEARRRSAPASLKPAAERASFLVADAEHIPFRDASFDALTCIGVLEYVPDDSLALREMFRVLKPGGRLVLTAPHRNSPAIWTELGLFTLAGLFKKRERQAFHRNYTSGGLRRRITGAGFRVLSSRFVSYLPYNVAIRLPNAARVDLALRRLVDNGPAEGLGVTLVIGADKPRA